MQNWNEMFISRMKEDFRSTQGNTVFMYFEM